MKTLGQLRQVVYNKLQEDNPQVVTSNPNTHFPSSSVIDGYLNEAVEFAAVFIEHNRDLVSVQAEEGVGSYSNPVDNLLLRTAYFGNRDSLTNDIRPLRITIEETLREMYPSWLDQTSGSTSDRPEYLIQLDKKTIYVFPRPNAIGAASGKKIWLNYGYVPATIAVDSDVPDLPAPYHNLLPLYALHLAYIDLKNVAISKEMERMFMDKVKLIQSEVTQESKDALGFSWGMDIDVGDNFSGGVIP